MFYSEFYKIYSKLFSIAFIILPTYLVSYYFLVVKLNTDFVLRLAHWCKISHDCNPYSFLINQTLSATILSLIYIITLLTFLILSSEYSNNTFNRIYQIKRSIFQILGVKVVVCLCIIGVFLTGQYCLFRYLVYEVSTTYPSLFAGYHYIPASELIDIGIIVFCSILKIVAFQFMLSVVCQRYSFIPVTVGILGVLSYLFPFSPYSILVRTNWKHQLDILMTYAVFGFAIYLTVSVAIIKIWANKKYNTN